LSFALVVIIIFIVVNITAWYVRTNAYTPNIPIYLVDSNIYTVSDVFLQGVFRLVCYLRNRVKQHKEKQRTAREEKQHTRVRRRAKRPPANQRTDCEVRRRATGRQRCISSSPVQL
jgi:hypothetical protein